MIWLVLFWLAVLAAGNAEVLVTLVNRVHALPIRHGPLKHVRHLHDLLIPCFPAALMIYPGLTGPAVLLDPVHPSVVWKRLPGPVQFWFAVCLAGFAGLVWSTIRYHLRRRPRQETSYRSEIEDVARSLGRRPVGDGPFRALTSFPGNQCFEVEWSSRTFCLSRLPPGLDGIRILHLTDVHFIGTVDRDFFQYLFKKASELDFDLVVFTGDLLDDERLVEWIPETFGQLSAPLGQYFILGNHDWYLDQSPIRDSLSNLGWLDVAGLVRVVEVGGAQLAIGGTERPWMGEYPDWSPVPDQALRLLLSHTPDNLAPARCDRVDLMLTGHNHGGQVVLPGIGPVYSPSLHGVKYAGGTFFADPTLVLVSRGISGRHPLRINCRPEIATLTLCCTE